MKKILFFVFLLNTILVCAQNGAIQDKPDWWNSGKPVSKNDTTQTAPIKSIKELHKPDSAYFEFIKSCCFVLKQDYSLYDKRKKKFYGYNDQGKFGTTYSIGIKCKGFNLIFDEAVYPWEYDSKYKSFESNKLTPILTSSKYAPIQDSLSLNYISLDTIITPSNTIKDHFLYTCNPFTSTQEGFEINNSDTCRVGVLVWIYKEKGDFENNDVMLGFTSSTTSINMGGYVDISVPDKKKDYFACVLLTTNNDGTNNYYLTGIATQKKQKWTLNFPFKGFEFNKKNKPSNVEESGRLTEIKQFD